MVADNTAGANRERGRRTSRKATFGTERLCAVTRRERPLSELIRFVQAPDGAIIVDLKRNLPGRGVWLTADRRHLDKAIKTGAFARSLKGPVVAAPELVEQVEALLVRRAVDSLSLANKAGLAMAGFTKVQEALMADKLMALLHGTDAAPDGCQKLSQKFKSLQEDRGFSAPIVTSLTITQLSLAMGRTNVVHAGLKKGGSSEAFLSDVQRLQRFRFGIEETADTPTEQQDERING